MPRIIDKTKPCLLSLCLLLVAGCAAPERETETVPAPNLPLAEDILEFRVTTSLFLEKKDAEVPHETFVVFPALMPEFLQHLYGTKTEKLEEKWPLIAEITLTMRSGPPISLWLFYTGEGVGAYQIFYHLRGGKIETHRCRGGDEQRWIELMKQARAEYDLAEEKRAEEIRQATKKE